MEPCSGFPELLPEGSWEVGGEARPPRAGLGNPFTGLLQAFVESWELFYLAGALLGNLLPVLVQLWWFYLLVPAPAARLCGDAAWLVLSDPRSAFSGF